MSDAVFSISADITPQIDERELERQGLLLSRRINGVLASKINKLDVAPVSGSFKPLEREANRILTPFNRITATLGKEMPKAISSVVRTGKGAFLKFADAVNITRRDMVGFGVSILDTIKSTNQFETAINGIKTAGTGISQLSEGVQQFAAQAQIGSSLLDRAAFAGDKFAQFLQPLQVNGTAANLELSELNRSLDVLTGSISKLAPTSSKTGSIVADQFGQTEFNQQIQNMEKLLTLLPKGSQAYIKMKGSIEQANNEGSKAGIVEELLQAKDAAQKLTGPLGRIAQLINEKTGGRFFKDVTKESREAAIALEQGAIKQIRELGAGDLLGTIENLTAKLRNISDRAKAIHGAFAPVGEVISKFGSQARASLSSVGNSITSSLLGRLPKFRNEALSAEEAMNKWIGGASNLDIAVKRIQKSVDGTARSFGSFLGKNLVGPLKAAGPQIKEAFSTIGKDVANGLGLSDNVTAKFQKVFSVISKAKAKILPTKIDPVIEAKALPKVEVTPVKPINVAPIKAPLSDLCIELQKCFESLNIKMDASIGKAGQVASQAGKAAVQASKVAVAPVPKLSVVEQMKALGELPKQPPVYSAAGTGPRPGTPLRGPGFGASSPVAELKLPKLPDDSALKAQAKKSGHNVILGFAQGVIEEKAAIVRAALATKQSVITNINQVFGIASAAKTMKPKGKNLVEGLAQGATENSGILKRAIEAVGKAALSAVNPLNTLKMVGKGLAAGFNVIKPAIIGAGVALAGFVTTAAVTGIQFNTLKQVINATLPVVLGSASAARTLLDEVNELNDSSPFARQSFLELTKVLAGFGVEAKAITPLIDAIQQSVAATGGGEGDLLELGQAFAKIQTQGRLTSESLQTFSVRGIDVISLLGQSMGKTTGEIKGMISDGMIPAKLALDTLTVALKDKFGGATDAVSKNFPGAMDRMKAKVRDFGGILTAAFVSPEGGGALVDFVNSLASAMGHINKNILPMFRDHLEALGAALSTVGKFIEGFTKAISGEAVAQFTGQLGGLLPVFAGIVGFMPMLLQGVPVIGGLLGALGGWPLALGLILATMEPVREAFGGLIKTLGPAVKEFLPKMSSLFKALSDAIGPLAATLINALGPILAEIMNAFGVLADALKPIIASFGRLFKALEPVVDIIKSVVIVQLKMMQGWFKVILAILDPIISRLADFAEFLKPAFEEVARFLNELIASGKIERFFEALAGGAKQAIEKIKPLIGFVEKVVEVIQWASDKLGVGIEIGLPKFDSAKETFIAEAKSMALGATELLTNPDFKGVFENLEPEVQAKMRAAVFLVQEQIPAFEKLGSIDLFETLFGNLDLEKQVSTAFKLDNISKEVGTSALDILEVLSNQDFKGAFGNLDYEARFVAASMVDDIEFGADKILKILNEKDFRKSFGKLDAATQLTKANLILAGRDIQGVFDSATKSIETITKAMGEANDQLKQAIDKAAGIINGMISAAKAVETANAAVVAARLKAAEATKDISKLEKDYARALEDTISASDELAVAQRQLTRIRKGLIDLDREEIRLGKDNKKLLQDVIDLQQELIDLRGEEAAEDRAALARGEERAQISLNQAKQAELDLLDELNGKQKVSLNLAGLSLDQIRAKLAAARLSSKKEGRDKTPQEIADMKRSARLDVEDAEAGVESAKEASLNFEVDTLKKIDEANEKILDIGEQIRDNNERVVAIGDDRADQLLDEQQAVRDLNRLLEGETTWQKVILDYDEKIAAAKVIEKTAAEAIQTAVEGAAIAQGEFKLKAAEASGNVDDILTAQRALWTLQGGDLLTSNKTLRDIMGEQLTNVEKARDAAIDLGKQLAAANKLLGAGTALQSASGSLASFDSLYRQQGEMVARDDPQAAKIFALSETARQDFMESFRVALASGAAEQKGKNQEPWFPSGTEIEALIRRIAELATKMGLRDAVRDALKEKNLSMPGFAAAHGYSPGDLVHQGMNNGVGLMRWAEFGKEAVLPLTRKFDMARVVQSPQVLPAVLNALPRWRMPESTSSSDSSVSDLSTMIRSGRSSGGPANADVYQKKSQREFASTIGDAVKIAVKAAIDESDGLGSDVDINVMPSSGNEKLIAREVKRQLNKALGKSW